jgi:hypothetical protein
MKPPPKFSKIGSGSSRKDSRAIARGKLRRRIRRLQQMLDLVEAAIAGVREAPGRTNQPQILNDLEGAIRSFRRGAESATLTILPPKKPGSLSAPPP